MKNCNLSCCTVSAGAAALVAVFWVVYALLTYVIFARAGVDPTLGAVLAATAGTIVGSVALVVVARWMEGRAAALRDLREKRTAVYDQLLQHLLKLVMGRATGEVVPEAEVLRFMTNFAQRMMVWGSEDVLAAWSRLRTAMCELQANSGTRRAMLAYEDLVRAVRRDLGYQDRELEAGKLMALFVDKMPTQ
ncbi:MAG TPA: hypothetical protein VJL29_11685 [Thermoguttaceae bacterium]|nr:hypothetical protein [Thermoguttaceae bacterium]